MTAVYENPEMVRLFRTYTNPQAPERNSTGDHLSRVSYERNYGCPLIVATGADVGFYPGDGALPTSQAFRHNASGFKELAGISHLGPAIASLVRLHELGGDDLWREDAKRLLHDIELVRRANSVELWSRAIGVAAFVGREAQIARMVDYSCEVTARYLRRSLSEAGYLSATSLRTDLLIGAGNDDLPVSFNQIMVGTFALVGLDTSHRMITWFDSLDLDWEHALVMLVGRQGRPTSGITKSTNSMARILQIASRGRLPDERLFIAPHAPKFTTPQGNDLSSVIALEDTLRWMLARLMSAIELAPIMYAGYPQFEPPPVYGPDLDEHTATVTEMPRIKSPDDWPVMITRLRLALEDPRQLLASGVIDYLAEQLVQHNNDPAEVVVPGLDGAPYP